MTGKLKYFCLEDVVVNEMLARSPAAQRKLETDVRL
jgi:hypothetical protein